MLALKITRWLLGYVRFSVVGGSPERFFSYSARAGAYFWNIAGRPQSGACVAARGYRGSARKAGCRLRVREKRGLPFFLYGMRGHRGIFAGAAAFAVILYLLSLHVWCVQVEGNVSVPEEQILSELSSAGLSPGAWKKDVNPGALAQSVMLKFPQIRWMSINTLGCTAQAVVQEKTAKPDIVDEKGVCNIKAASTGQVLEMKVYEGTPVVAEGDAVVKGQLLVSAVVEDQLGKSALRHARAEILAETQHAVSVSVEREQLRYEPTGKVVVRRNADLYGVRIPLSLAVKPHGSYRLSREKIDLRLFGNILPAGLYTERWEEVRPVHFILTKDQALQKAKQEAGQKIGEFLGDGKIVSSKSSETWTDNSLTLAEQLVCEENIAEESEIFTE